MMGSSGNGTGNGNGGLGARLARIERQMMAARSHPARPSPQDDDDPAVVREVLYARWLAAAGITPEQYAAADTAERAYAHEMFAEELRAEVRRRYPAHFAAGHGVAQAQEG